MKKNTFILILSLILACNKNKAQVAGQHVIEKAQPTENIVSDTIKTVSTSYNTKILSHLISQLNKEGFVFKSEKARFIPSFPSKTENTVLIIDGPGIGDYFAKSVKPEKGTNDIYPEFKICTFIFLTQKEAQKNFERITDALSSHKNIETPYKILIKENQIFYLFTQEERFRAYLEKYGKTLEDYN
ncbi:hypothetical protein [Chryseobacterium sp.]|uniref:hypothetical protein n=1 Tax=Chryseobacterium sp. TaxID=1871047 RepID=UPI0025BA8DCE|nr:hypothetical protein [Chryseobacterium sp.]